MHFVTCRSIFNDSQVPCATKICPWNLTQICDIHQWWLTEARKYFFDILDVITFRLLKNKNFAKYHVYITRDLVIKHDIRVIYSTGTVNECVQKPSALTDKCVVQHFHSELENQCADGYYWSLIVHAHYVHSSCSKNLISRCGFISILLTTKGRTFWENFPNFTYHRSCMLISIVYKRNTQNHAPSVRLIL